MALPHLNFDDPITVTAASAIPVFSFNRSDLSNTVTITQSAANVLSINGGLVSNQLTFNASAGGTTEGMLWNDSTQKCLTYYTNSMKKFDVGLIYSQVTACTINTATTASIINTTNAIGSPAYTYYSLAVGKVFRIMAYGTYNWVSGSCSYKAFINTNGYSSQSITPTVTGTYWWELELTMTILALGSSGGYIIGGMMKFYNATTGALAFVLPIAMNGNATLLQTPGTIDIQFTQSAAGTFICSILTIEALA